MADVAKMIDGLGEPTARRIVDLLAVASAALHEGELIAAAGLGAARSLQMLEREGVVRREGGRVRLASEVSAAMAASVAEAGDELWTALSAVVEKTHAGWPQDPAVLLVRCRTLARSGNAGAALDMLERSRAAKLAVDLGQLEATLRAMAAGDPSVGPRALLLLAREQLRRGEVDRARHALAEVEFLRDELTTDEFSLLRAEAHARAGQPRFAVEDLKLASFTTRGGLVSMRLMMAGLSMLAGRLHEARRILVALARETRDDPELEGRRWAALSLSYVLEERYGLARASARRARSAYRHPDTAPLEPLLWLIDFLSRLRLDDIDAAAAMAAAERRFRLSDQAPIPSLVRAALVGRQGDLQGCLSAARECAERLDRRADRFLLAIVQRYMARAAMDLGQLDRAEALIRELAGAAKDGGLAVLEPMCELEFALLAQSRGDPAEARRRALRALELAPKNPYVRVEAWVLADAPLPSTASMHPSLRGYVHLRAAERALRAGALDDAVRDATVACDWYHAVGARADEARAFSSLGEAYARLGRYDDATRALDVARELATRLALSPLLVADSLIRASIADRRGDIDEYVRSLASATRIAHPSLIGRAMVQACARAGFVAGPWTARVSPFGPLVERLGLVRPVHFLITVGDRTCLADSSIDPGADLQLDLEMGSVTGSGRTWDLSAQPLLSKLLDSLVDAGDNGLPAELLYRQVWGQEYHALRHRNTLYGAINRLRRGLASLVAGRQVIVQTDGNYRLSGATVAVVRAARAAAAQHERVARRAALAGSPLPDPHTYAERFGISVALARWDLALLQEQDTDVEVVSRRSWPETH